ncbi:MAG TPA: universal stress protein [Pyrinomonadaceae bacterium]|jgi:nucleotide-binding universal stress UspA family protein|nr:universal stress protein [Pyrinomonadaceae bacterium]
MKVLIGYDGSECADAALDDLTHAGLPPDAEAQILSVGEVWLPPPPPSTYEIIEQAREAKSQAELERNYAKGCNAAKEALVLAERARQRVQTNFPNWKVTADSSCGSAAWELVSKADHWKPDLIVVGSHGRTALGRFVLGSVSQRVLTEALCSVRIARGRVDEPNSPMRIVVGTDGSPASDLALKAVAARKWPPQSEVMVVLVDDPLAPEFLGKLIPPLGETIEEDRREEKEWVEEISERSLELLRDAAIKVTCVVKEGDPKRELCKAAEEWGADCIFVGSTGFSNRFERFILGSVSAAVAARAHCSVEVVRKTSK